MKKILGDKPFIGKNTTLVESSFGKYVEIGAYNDITESFMDDYSYTSMNCQIIYSKIGKFVNIASYVRLNPGQHPKEWVCQHHMLYRKEMYGFGLDDEEFFNHRREKQVLVGHDVWIGHNVTVMGGVTIGNGAVIGSGAIVTKDIPAYAIVVGNPAKIIKFRFNSEIIDKLQEIQWWNWDKDKIKNSLEEFKDIESFVEKYA
ncbi:DapH/DapD/GlmU-related protein [Sulfurospirillum sp. 1307]